MSLLDNKAPASTQSAIRLAVADMVRDGVIAIGPAYPRETAIEVLEAAIYFYMSLAQGPVEDEAE